MSTASNRDAARAKAKAMREEQARAARKKNILIIVAAIVITAAVIAAVIFGSRSSTPAAGASGDTPTVVTSAPEGFPQHTTETGAIPFGKTMVAGSVNEGAAVVDVYFDYACPHCAEFEALHADELAELATSGKATVVLHPVKILGSAWSDAVNNALAVVLNHDPDHAMEFHQQAFAILDNAVKNQNPQALTLQALVDAASEAGVPAEVSSQFTTDIEANSFQPWTAANTTSFQNAGLTGTPSVLINGTQVELQDINTPTGITDKVSALK